MEPIIKVDNVSMCFNLSKEKHESLKEYILAMVQGRLQYDEFYALKDVSLDIMPGDFYGLVGLNGSGKSTLLKTIAGVYKPSKGKVTVNGTIAPLIELGAGFDMDLTARENIYLNGTVLGFSPKYLDEKFDEIVEFSELQNFLDVPLKNYSSGMVARIGFAIATITKPDILIADEVLSVGDFLFQQKCEKRMQELMAGGTTVILVSHSIEQIERMCTKVAWLSHGHLKMNGDTETGVSIMQMDEGLDTGDVLYCKKIVIDPEETSGELFDRVTAVGAEALCETIPQIAAGTLTAVPQQHENATLAPMLNKEMAEFHLTDTAVHIHNWVRGMNPWPGAWFITSGGKKLKVMSSRVAAAHGEAPGTVLATKPLTVACGEGAIQLLEVVPEGKKPMDGTAFAAGLRLKTGDVL